VAPITFLGITLLMAAATLLALGSVVASDKGRPNGGAALRMMIKSSPLRFSVSEIHGADFRK
jgi:hypothetical protein